MADAFALANFAPADTTTFRLQKHGEHEFVIDGDPDTGDVVLMLRIEEQINTGETAAEQFAAAEEGKALLLRMIQARQPEITELRAGVQEILIIFALIVHGSSVAAAVAQAITAETPAAGDGEPDELEGQRAPGEESEGGTAGAPLPLPRLSSGASSSLDEPEGSLLATGTG